MFSIEQSPFLHALGYAIGHSLWQMSLLWLVYAGLVHLRKWNSSQRYNLAVALATAGFGWFLFTLIYYANVPPVHGASPALLAGFTQEGSLTQGGKIAFVYHSIMATLRSLAPYFSCAYLVVMLVLSIRLANGFNHVKTLRSQGLSKPPVDWRLFVKKHAAILGIERPVKFFVSEFATSPLTIGFWKPFVLIPLASLNQLTPQQMEAVLLHELAHIRRYDYLVNVLLQLAEIFLFFNPFMRLLLKHARLERENSCDDFVLQFQYNAADYAKALLVIEQNSVESLLALGTNNQNEFQLLHRVRRMLAPERKAFNYRQQLSLLFIITILGLGFTLISPKNNVEKGNVVKEQTVVVQPGEKSIEQFTPTPVDLIKNLESLKESNNARKRNSEQKTQSSEGKEKSAVAIATQPSVPANFPVAEPERIAEIRSMQTTGTGKPENPWQLKQVQGLPEDATAWTGIFAPLLEKPGASIVMLPSLKENDLVKLFGVTAPEAPSKSGKGAQAPATQPRVSVRRYTQKQLAEIEALQANLQKEQQIAAELAKEHKLLNDSLRHLIARAKNNAIAYERELAKARKEAAIAPYRVNNNRSNSGNARSNVTVSGYSLNGETGKVFDGSAEDIPNDFVYLYENRSVAKTKKADNPCECPRTSRSKTYTVIDGKAISEKVKKVWQEAQKTHQNGWTEEMQQQVVSEIEKELKNLEHLEIKTHISTKQSNNGRTFVIEVETNM